MPSRRFFSTLLAILLVLLVVPLVVVYVREHELTTENQFDPIITSVARETGMDPYLIRALIWRESRFKPLTHGSADEHGLMQVTPEVGTMWAKAHRVADFKDDDLYDPTTNIRVGSWYLNRSIKRWSQTDDPVTFALAEYNAGRSNALKWVDPNDPQSHVAFMQRITFPSTRRYVELILKQRELYSQSLSNSPLYRDFPRPSQSMTQAP